jgi:ribonuclease HI
MDAYPTPLAVGINVAEAYGKIAWGISSTDDHFLGEVMPAGVSVSDAFLAAFGALIERDDFRGLPIDLYCANADLCQALGEMNAVFSHITVHPWSETTSRGLLVRTAHKAAFTAIQTLSPERSVDLPSGATDSTDSTDLPVIAATDGSSGFRGRRNTRMVSGWGWITNTGTHGSGHIDGGSVLAAELYAIRALLESTRTDTRLIVLSDSKDALRIVEALQHGESPTAFTFTGVGKALSTLRRLQALLTDRDVTFQWVRSHSGHALNEGADRLAVHARRAAQCELAKDTHDALIRQIVEETLQVLPTTTAAA